MQDLYCFAIILLAFTSAATNAGFSIGSLVACFPSVTTPRLSSLLTFENTSPIGVQT